MTEKERMVSGLPFDSRDPELLNRYHEVRRLLSKYTRTPSDDSSQKEAILRSLFGSTGSEVWIESPFFCDYGEQIHIGSHVFINYNCVFLDSNNITIGDNSLIGPSVHIYTTSHPLRAEERIRTRKTSGSTETYYLTVSKPVSVEKNTWIGGGTLLMPGVTIGENSTIGAGSIVTKSIPPNCFAAGNPCKVLKQLD